MSNEVKEIVNEENIEESSEELTKKEKKLKKKKLRKGIKSNWADFKKFIAKGNAFDMAIGVVLGGAFTAIVTSITSILLNLVSWPSIGGLDSLISVLPAANRGQAGLDGVGQTFIKADLDKMIEILVKAKEGRSVDAAEKLISSNYKLYGNLYVYNGAAIINWGAFINALISFIIVAIVLFLILKAVVSVSKATSLAQKKALEEYYKKHPDERPIVKEKEPEKTEKELLNEIVNILKLQNADLIQKENKKKELENKNSKKK